MNVSLVEFMYVAFIARQVELSGTGQTKDLTCEQYNIITLLLFNECFQKSPKLKFCSPKYIKVSSSLLFTCDIIQPARRLSLDASHNTCSHTYHTSIFETFFLFCSFFVPFHVLCLYNTCSHAYHTSIFETFLGVLLCFFSRGVL